MNPMLAFDKNLPLDKLQALMQLHSLLGGLGNQPASRVLSPTLAKPPIIPEVSTERSILGGTING